MQQDLPVLRNNLFPKASSSEDGLTLIELLIVVTIIVILAVMGLMSSRGQVGKARDSQRKNDLHQLRVAFEDYATDYGCYPSAAEYGSWQCSSGDFRPYLPKLPCDPYNDKKYLYDPLPACKGFTLYTLLENDTDPDINAGACYATAVGETVEPCDIADFDEPYPTFAPTPVPTSVPEPTPTATPTPTPPSEEELISTNENIEFIEYQPAQDHTVFIRVEVDPSISVDRIVFWVNGSWVNQDSSAPYLLGGSGGYTLPLEQNLIRAIVYYNSTNYIDAYTAYDFSDEAPPEYACFSGECNHVGPEVVDMCSVYFSDSNCQGLCTFLGVPTPLIQCDP